MREGEARWAARWRALGRLLPRDVRERVFEPAFYDLLHGWLTDGRARGRLSFGCYAVGTVAGCLPMAVSRIFVANGRLTRFGRLTVASLATLTLLIALLQGLTRYDAGY